MKNHIKAIRNGGMKPTGYDAKAGETGFDPELPKPVMGIEFDWNRVRHTEWASYCSSSRTYKMKRERFGRRYLLKNNK
ncbi:MAG: hypothetical protein QW597_06650 [Thermoplasmataceae archaeon]